MRQEGIELEGGSQPGADLAEVLQLQHHPRSRVELHHLLRRVQDPPPRHTHLHALAQVLRTAWRSTEVAEGGGGECIVSSTGNDLSDELLVPGGLTFIFEVISYWCMKRL